MGDAHSRHLSKGRVIHYMDVKYLSECIDMERRYVRLKIFEWRKSQRFAEAGSGITVLKSYRLKKEIMRSFYRYSMMTRLYHKTRRAYLEQLSQRY